MNAINFKLRLFAVASYMLIELKKLYTQIYIVIVILERLNISDCSSGKYS
jgi:hypothetical protein